jgi:hypothetical protein
MRHLGMPKEKAELLGSRLKENNLLAAGMEYLMLNEVKIFFLNFPLGFFPENVGAVSQE